MGLRGSVKAFSLEQLLEFLSASGHSGSLDVFRQDARKTLYLSGGSLHLERSNWSFRLGDALVRSGELAPAHLEEALAVQRQREGQRLGDVLRELGHVTEEKIIAARRFQVEEEIYEVFSWEDAFFDFKKDEFPEDFEERKKDPDEFKFPASSVLVEATRRQDEWQNIQEALPSEKRLLILGDGEKAAKRAGKELAEAAARVQDAAEVFNGRRTVGELPHYLGLSRFEAQSVICRLLNAGHIRQLTRGEVEKRFATALKGDVQYGIQLYECALESPEFDSRGRLLDRVFFGSDKVKEEASEGRLAFSANLAGKRAFELFLALFRQGIACEFTAREEGRTVRFAFGKSSLVWRVDPGADAPNIVKHLLARSPVSAADLVRVRETQEQTGRSLQQILVGGGYVTMENWFRAQKDTVLNAIFKIFFLRRPFVEVRTGEDASPTNAGLDVDVPLLPWLSAEVTREIRQWESLMGAVPSVHAYLIMTSKGQRASQRLNDPFLLFNGERSLDEVVEQQDQLPAPEFLQQVHDMLQNGRLQSLDADGYRERVEGMIAADKRGQAITCCTAAIDSRIDPTWFKAKLRELRAADAEIAQQTVRATFKGDLDQFSLPEVLQTFHLRKSSGTMRVEATEGDTKLARQIYFDQGEVYLLSGDMEEELTEEDLEAGLVAAGLVTEDQLADAAATQMKDEVYEMFIWEGAEFEFAADYLPPEFYATKKNRKIRLNTVRFLLEAVRRIADWEEVRRMIPGDHTVLAFDSPVVKMATVNDMGYEDLLLLVDSRHAVGDLVRMSRMRRFKALSILADLVQDGRLKIVDLEAIQEEDEDALFATDLPTSGVIEGGFVGQIQFVGTLQDLAGADLTGVMRLTDGRRSKEIALIDGDLYRTNRFTRGAESESTEQAAIALSPEAARLKELEAMDLSTVPEDQRGRIEMEMKLLGQVVAMEDDGDGDPSNDELSPEAARLQELEATDLSTLSEEEQKRAKTEMMMLRAAVEMEEEQRLQEEREAIAKEAAVDTARDVAECFSWSGTRFELLQGTLHPRLEDEEERHEFRLDGETFFDEFASAGENWVKVGELIPRDLAVVYRDDDCREAAADKAAERERPDLVDLVDGQNTPEDVARISRTRYDTLCWLVELFEEGLVDAVEPDAGEGDSEEDWDFSL